MVNNLDARASLTTKEIPNLLQFLADHLPVSILTRL